MSPRVYERVASVPRLVAYGSGGRRHVRVSNAILVGMESKRGDACPYRKRKYVAAWRWGVDEQRARRLG